MKTPSLCGSHPSKCSSLSLILIFPTFSLSSACLTCHYSCNLQVTKTPQNPPQNPNNLKPKKENFNRHILKGYFVFCFETGSLGVIKSVNLNPHIIQGRFEKIPRSGNRLEFR